MKMQIVIGLPKYFIAFTMYDNGFLKKDL